MNPFFELAFPVSEQLWAEWHEYPIETFPCPITSAHSEGGRRLGPIHFDVKHNRRDELMIWGNGLAVHDRIVEGFEREGFTGYRLKPATVRFRDGSISTEYHEFIVTGWAGVASPESGVRVIESCPACLWKNYSPITDFEKVIDWSQWTGEDFFIVWPMTQYKLCTERVAQWLLGSKVKSFRLEKEFAQLVRRPIIAKLEFHRGRLSSFLPEDLAIKYGRPLGLE
jgi:hypothetical protein